jgi:hypothetical protein
LKEFQHLWHLAFCVFLYRVKEERKGEKEKQNEQASERANNNYTQQKQSIEQARARTKQ